MSKTFLFLVVVIAALAVGSIWFFTGSSNSSDQTSSAPSLEIKTTDNMWPGSPWPRPGHLGQLRPILLFKAHNFKTEPETVHSSG